MGSNGSGRRSLLTAGGTLITIGGALEVIGGGALVGLVVSPAVRRALLYPLILPIDPPMYPVMPTWLIAVGVPLLILGAIAIVGGVSAARRKSFGLSLAGAIPALSPVIHNLRLVGTIFCTLPSVPLGMLAIIFVALGKREFGPK